MNEGSYMEDLNSTLSRPFLKGVGPIEKKNQGMLVGSHVCATTTLNRTISSEKLWVITNGIRA